MRYLRRKYDSLQVGYMYGPAHFSACAVLTFAQVCGPTTRYLITGGAAKPTHFDDSVEESILLCALMAILANDIHAFVAYGGEKCSSIGFVVSFSIRLIRPSSVNECVTLVTVAITL